MSRFIQDMDKHRERKQKSISKVKRELEQKFNETKYKKPVKKDEKPYEFKGKPIDLVK